MFFLKNHVESEATRPVPGFILFSKNVLYEVKLSGLRLSFNMFR